MDQIAVYKEASDHFTKLISQVKDWDAPTPCSEWNVRELVNHVVSEALWIKPLFAGKTIAEVGDSLDGDILGDNPKQTWQRARTEAVAALNQPDALAKTVHLSYGDRTGTQYMEPMATDVIIHGWDLAAAIGADRTINPAIVKYTLDSVTAMLAKYGNGGSFGPEFKLSADQAKDPQNQLLALTGRNPDWQPSA